MLYDLELGLRYEDKNLRCIFMCYSAVTQAPPGKCVPHLAPVLGTQNSLVGCWVIWTSLSSGPACLHIFFIAGLLKRTGHALWLFRSLPSAHLAFSIAPGPGLAPRSARTPGTRDTLHTLPRTPAILGIVTEAITSIDQQPRSESRRQPQTPIQTQMASFKLGAHSLYWSRKAHMKANTMRLRALWMRTQFWYSFLWKALAFHIDYVVQWGPRANFFC